MYVIKSLGIIGFIKAIDTLLDENVWDKIIRLG